MSILELVKSKLMASIKSKMAALMLKPQLKSLKKEFDYEEYGGAPILGVDGPVLKIHGSSTANAVRNAIIKSVPYSKENVGGDHPSVHAGAGGSHRKRLKRSIRSIE